MITTFTSEGSMPLSRSCAARRLLGPHVDVLVDEGDPERPRFEPRADRHRGVEAGVDQDRAGARVLDQEARTGAVSHWSFGTPKPEAPCARPCGPPRAGTSRRALIVGR